MTPSIDSEHTPDTAERLTCQQVTDLIIDYVTDDMDATVRAAFERLPTTACRMQPPGRTTGG